MTAIGDYVGELRSKLRVGRYAERRILQEIRAHLQDAAHAEEQLGIHREEAERRAVERLGPAEALGARFSADRRLPSWMLAWAAACAVAGAAGLTLTLIFTLGGTAGSNTRSVVRSLTFSDQSGSTMSISPTSVVVGPGGITETLTYTAAAGGLDGGAVEVTVPANWTSPDVGSAGATITSAAFPSFTWGPSPNILNPGVIEPRTALSCPGSVWCRFANLWSSPPS